MNNPFKKNQYMLPIASINSIYIDDVKASDLFRLSIIIDEINQNRESLGIASNVPDKDLLSTFNNLLNSEFDSVKKKANQIARDLGNRLSMVLKTLYKPSLLSVSNRKNWSKIHWDFWQSIHKIYFVGGVTAPILIKIFYEEIMKTFESFEIKNVEIVFKEASNNLGTKGLSEITDNGSYLLFDFGQTSIKRSHFIKKNNVPIIDMTLPNIKSDYLFYKHKNDEELNQIALKLHQYIVETICKTMKEVDFDGNQIYMAIANYVYEGMIYAARGGYGKLALLSDNYQNYLSEDLSNKVGKKINVTLYHDTTAMAFNFKGEKNTAVISLGTAFGVAFPE